MRLLRKTMEIPCVAEALPGRPDPIPTPDTSFINGRFVKPPFPEGQGGFVLHGFLNPPNEITAGLDILPAL